MSIVMGMEGAGYSIGLHGRCIGICLCGFALFVDIVHSQIAWCSWTLATVFSFNCLGRERADEMFRRMNACSSF